MGQIHFVNIIHAKPSLCPVGRLSPVNGRELNKTEHPTLNLSPVYGGKVAESRIGGNKKTV